MAHARTPGPYGINERKNRNDGLLARQELSVSGPVGLSDSTSQGVTENRFKVLRPPVPSLPTLQAGTRSSDVKKLQQLLNSRLRGAQLPLDGHFNQSTRDAVMIFQKAKGISSDGVVGKSTWYQLIVTKRSSVQLSRNLTVAQSVGNANSTPPLPRTTGRPNEPVWEWPLHEKLLEVVKRVPSRLPSEARREWNAMMSPESIAIALGTIALAFFFSDGLALFVGIAVLGIDATRNLILAIETAALATSDDDLNKAADDLAHVVISVGVTILLAGLLKFAGKLSAGDAPETGTSKLGFEANGQEAAARTLPKKTVVSPPPSEESASTYIRQKPVVPVETESSPSVLANPAAIAEDLLRVGKFQYARAAGNHVTDIVLSGESKGLLARPYMTSQQTIEEIIATGRGVPDPHGIPGVLRFDVPGTFRGSKGIWELVLNPETKMIYHFNFVTSK